MYQYCTSIRRRVKNSSILSPINISTSLLSTSATAVTSLSQDFLWYWIDKANVLSSALAVTYNRLTEYVLVGVAESCLGPWWWVMTDLQATTMVTREPTSSPLFNRVNTSTPCQSAEQSFNLSSLVNSSMEMWIPPLIGLSWHLMNVRRIKNSNTSTIMFDTSKHCLSSHIALTLFKIHTGSLNYEGHLLNRDITHTLF